MKQYFMQLEMNLPKNKAQIALQEFARQFADCLIDEVTYEQFKKDFNEKITSINQEFMNCTDIAPLRQNTQWLDPQELQINVDAGITFLIRTVKGNLVKSIK